MSWEPTEELGDGDSLKLIQTDESPPSIAIILGIAQLEGIDPLDMDFLLHDKFDVDSFDRFLESTTCPKKDNGDVSIVGELRIGNYTIMLTEDEDVFIKKDGSLQ